MTGSERDPEVAVRLLEAADSHDAELVERLTQLVNDVYRAAESGLWREGAGRTTASELAELVAAGQIAVATRDGRIAGSVRIHDVADDESEVGMLVADPERAGHRRRPGPHRVRRAAQPRARPARDPARAARPALLAAPDQGVPQGLVRPAGATGSPARAASTTRIRTSRRCSPPRATSPSTRSRFSRRREPGCAGARCSRSPSGSTAPPRPPAGWPPTSPRRGRGSRALRARGRG